MKMGYLSYPEAKRRLIKLWKSNGNANKFFMEDMFRSWHLKKGAKETVDYLKKSYRLCIISGSLDLYVSVVAEKLGIKDWYANTKIVWDSQGNLIDLNYFSDQSAKKLEQFEEYVVKYNLNRNKCAIVGDSDNDLALFKELKYGILLGQKQFSEMAKLVYRNVKKIGDLKKIF